MHVKSISGTVTSTVTLGAGGYGSHLTITPTGEVAPATAGATAIVAPASLDHAKITNQGALLGAAGVADEGNGGAGIDLTAAGVVVNVGTITGGMSGNAYRYHVDPSGGTGVILEQTSSLFNTGTIAAGNGKTEQQSSYVGGQGGVGVDLTGAGDISNHGTISGGIGGNAYSDEGTGGRGGDGIDLSGAGRLTNGGAINGGNAGTSGGTGGYDGGMGVSAGQGAVILNNGTIAGGLGGDASGGYGAGGRGGTGVDFTSGGTLVNHGVVSGSAAGGGEGSDYGGNGVLFGGIGVLINSGTIAAGFSFDRETAGVSLASGTVTNSGTISGGVAGGTGVYFGAGGTVTNTGTITGGYGLDFHSEPDGGTGIFVTGTGTIVNRGTIAGGNGGKLNSSHTGGNGGNGVYLGGGTLVTYGAIAGGLGGKGGLGNGTPGDAVRFGTLTATLVVEPHATFVGDIAANAAASDTLELAGMGGTLTGFGTTVTGFTTITEDAAAHWVLTGEVSGNGSLIVGSGGTLILDGPATIASVVLASGGNELLRLETSSQLTGTITGFGTGDVIDLRTIRATSLSYDQGTLTLFDTNHTLLDTLTFAGDYTQSDFTLRYDGVSGTGINYSGPDTQEHRYQAVTTAHQTDTAPALWHIAPA